MIFLLTQMFVGLSCALVAGGAAGWLICRARTVPAVNALRETVQRQRVQVDQARTDVSLISQDFDELDHRSREQIDTLTDENRRLPSMHHNLEKSQLLVRQLMQKHEAQLRDLATERDSLRARLATQADREEALRSVSAELDRARRRLVTIDVASPSQDAANTDSLHTKDETVPETSDHERTADAGVPAMPEPGHDGPVEVDPGTAHGTGETAGTNTAVEPPADADDDGDERTDGTAGPTTSSWASARMPDISIEDVAGVDRTHGIDPDAGGQATPPAHDAPDPLLDDVIELDELDAAPAHGEEHGDGHVHDVAQAEPVLSDADDTPLFNLVDRHDDLKRIFGIGPMTEKALNQLGITSYSQLAELERHDIETIADALQIFPDRIERDDWVGNARRQLEDVLEEL